MKTRVKVKKTFINDEHELSSVHDVSDGLKITTKSLNCEESIEVTLSLEEVGKLLERIIPWVDRIEKLNNDAGN